MNANNVVRVGVDLVETGRDDRLIEVVQDGRLTLEAKHALAYAGVAVEDQCCRTIEG